MPAYGRFRRQHLATSPSFVGAGGIVVLGIALFVFAAYAYVFIQTQEHAAAQLEAVTAAVAEIPLLTRTEASRLRTYRNNAHLRRAAQLGLHGLHDREDAARQIDEGTLVALTDNDYYRLQRMHYSVPYVTESTAALLELIGRRFQEALREEGLPPYRYVITSGTRTRLDQRALRGVNLNAAARSSHEFGTTVDLHYGKFSYAAAQDTLPGSYAVMPALLRTYLTKGYTRLAVRENQTLKAILGRVLLDLQREGKVLVIYERRQPVYHITLNQSL